MKLQNFAIAAAAFGLSTMIGAGPAMAATTVTAVAPNLVTVKWKTTATATLTVFGNWQYAAGVMSTNATPGTILTSSPAPSNGSCGTAGATASNTVDFGSIAPDSSAAFGCMYERGLGAVVTTNSNNWTLTQTLATAPTAGFTLCAVPYANQTTAPTYTAIAATAVPTTCAAANTISTTAVNVTPASTTVGATYVQEDLDLIIAANAPVYTNSGDILTLTLVAN
jgi:hypothetical protein